MAFTPPNIRAHARARKMNRRIAMLSPVAAGALLGRNIYLTSMTFSTAALILARLALTKYLRPSWTAKARTIGHADNRAGCVPGEAAAAVPRKSAAAIARATRPRRRACHVKPTCAGANGPSRSREWTRFEPRSAPAEPHK